MYSVHFTFLISLHLEHAWSLWPLGTLINYLFKIYLMRLISKILFSDSFYMCLSDHRTMILWRWFGVKIYENQSNYLLDKPNNHLHVYASAGGWRKKKTNTTLFNFHFIFRHLEYCDHFHFFIFIEFKPFLSHHNCVMKSYRWRIGKSKPRGSL